MLGPAQNQVDSLPPGASRRLPALHTLLLRQNRLAALPEDLADLASLINLDLAGNRLAALPAALCALSGLQRLALEYGLTPLPHRLGIHETLALVAQAEALQGTSPILQVLRGALRQHPQAQCEGLEWLDDGDPGAPQP